MLSPIEHFCKIFVQFSDFAASCIVSLSLNASTEKKKKVNMFHSESTEIVGTQVKYKNKSNFSENLNLCFKAPMLC